MNLPDKQQKIPEEFKLLAKVVSQYLPPESPYDVVGGARNVKQADNDPN